MALRHNRVDIGRRSITLVLDTDVSHGHFLLDIGRTAIVGALGQATTLSAHLPSHILRCLQ